MTTRISLKAVIVGGIVDILLTFLLTLPVYIWVGFRSGAFTLPELEQTEAITAASLDDLGTYSLLLILGCLCSVVGGYIAASIARRDPVVHGAASGWLCFVLGIVSLATDTGGIPRPLLLLVVPLGPALGGLGGAWWIRRRLRRPSTPRRKVQRSLARRAIFSVLYAGAVFILTGIVGAMGLSDPCTALNDCTPAENAFSTAIGLMLFIGVSAAVIAAGMGYMPGARYRYEHAPADAGVQPSPAAEPVPHE